MSMIPQGISDIKHTQIPWSGAMDGTQPVSWFLIVGFEKNT